MVKHFMNVTLDSSEGGSPQFPPSRWTLVASAATEGPQAQAALDELYRLYAYPVYAFIRRHWRGYGPHDAQDHTQGFFVHLLQKATLGQADPQRGRFRSFLLRSLEHYLAHEAEKAEAGKRDRRKTVSYDATQEEDGYEAEAPGLTPRELYDKAWAVALDKGARRRLRQEMEAENKGGLFDALQSFLFGEGDAPYQEVAERLGLNLGTLKTHINRLRRRRGELLREEVARTVEKPEDLEEELRYVMRQLIDAPRD
jgi:RNA polymerase sigma factor (sigma-70 family)